MDFSKGCSTSDLVLMVEGKPLHVHRCILSLWSPVFDRMLNADFLEKESTHVTLPGKNYEQINEMLQIMYDRRRTVKDANVEYLFALADEYQMEQMRSECIKFIQTASREEVDPFKYISLIFRYVVTDLKTEWLNKTRTVSSENFERNEHFLRLDDGTKYICAQKRVAYLETQLAKYDASVQKLLWCLYGAAYQGRCEMLRERDLQDSTWSKCPAYKTHQAQRPGQNFDISCSTCRDSIRSVKQIQIQTSEMTHLLNSLYELNKEKHK